MKELKLSARFWATLPWRRCWLRQHKGHRLFGEQQPLATSEEHAVAQEMVQACLTVNKYEASLNKVLNISLLRNFTFLFILKEERPPLPLPPACAFSWLWNQRQKKLWSLKCSLWPCYIAHIWIHIEKEIKFNQPFPLPFCFTSWNFM